VLSISAVLPAYNEEQVIAASVAAMVKTFELLAADYEVIVVNDGSRDRTAEIVTQLGHENPRVRLVSHERNQGYGAAVWTGFISATKDLVFLTDGDKQFDVDEISLLLPMPTEAMRPTSALIRRRSVVAASYGVPVIASQPVMSRYASSRPPDSTSGV